MVYVKMASRTLLCNLCFDARSVICLLADNRPISFPVSSLPLSSETGNKDRNHQFLISVLLCLREVLYPFNQETFPREFLPWLHIGTCSVQSSFFLNVSFDRCIQCQKSNVKGPFKEVKRIFLQMPRQKHPLVIPAHILLYSEWA